MRRLVFLFLAVLVLPFIHLTGQVYENGVPLITNYPLLETAGTQFYSIIKDQRGVLYFGNNESMVIEYDGVNWRTIPIPNGSIIRSLNIDSAGTIYVGGGGEFGYLQPDDRGRMNYHSLVNKLSATDSLPSEVWKIIPWNDKVYFCASDRIFRYSISGDSIKAIYFRTLGHNNKFQRLSFRVNDKFYLGDDSHGLFEFINDSLQPAKGSNFFRNKFIVSVLPFNGNKLLIATADGRTFLFDPVTGNTVKGIMDDHVYKCLKEGRMCYAGLDLKNGQYAFGAVTGGGGLIINNEGTIISKFDKKTGLQDESIISLYSDSKYPADYPLWFGLDIGISKAEINSPIRTFPEFTGFTGAINNIIRFRGNLYLATHSGVYIMQKNDEGQVHFRKIEKITSVAWRFLKLTGNKGGGDRLLVGIEGGLCDISNLPAVEKIKIENCPTCGDEEIYYLCQSSIEPSMIYLGMSDKLVVVKHEGSIWRQIKVFRTGKNEIRSIAELPNGDLYFSSYYNGVYLIKHSSGKDSSITLLTSNQGLPTGGSIDIFQVGTPMFFATQKGLFSYDEKINHFFPDTTFGKVFADGSLEIWRMANDSDGDFYFSIKKKDLGYRELIVQKKNGQYLAEEYPFSRLPKYSADAIYPDEKGIVWIGKSNVLYRYDKNTSIKSVLPFYALIRKVTIGNDSVIFYGTNFRKIKNDRLLVDLAQPGELKPLIRYQFNDIAFQWASPFFEDEKSTEYRFWLEGNDKDWSRWLAKTEFAYTNLSKGKYLFKVQARNVNGIKSQIATFEFTILPPFYQTITAYIGYVLILILLIIAMVKFYTNRLKRENIRLEGIVRERTAELTLQKDEIIVQRDKIENQKELIEQKNRDITDSIVYASKIQNAMLPAMEVLKSCLPELFILYKPRDIVSGDFYWFKQIKNLIYIVAADCTGHGVPGAFMSMLGISLLNEIVGKRDVNPPNIILAELRKRIMKSLHQSEQFGESQDGMDIALCVIDLESRTLQFAGAFNPLYVVRKKESEAGVDLIELKADRMPIGVHPNDEQEFNNKEIKLMKGDLVYIFSDGYISQLGGEKSQRFKSFRLQQALRSIYEKPMEMQKMILEKTLAEWQGKEEQVDDILILGMRF